MATKQCFNTPKVPRSNTVFSQAVIAGGFIFLSGTAGVDPETGKLISDSFEEQARQAFRNIETILKEAGSDMSKIVKPAYLWLAGKIPISPRSIRYIARFSRLIRQLAARRN